MVHTILIAWTEVLVRKMRKMKGGLKSACGYSFVDLLFLLLRPTCLGMWSRLRH
jgi:hypothetical protein